MTVNGSQETARLTDRQRKALTIVQDRGAGPFALTTEGRIPATVLRLVELGYLEKLNRLRPGLPVYEITAAGRAALRSAR